MIRIVSRHEWGADPRSLPQATMRLPATAVYLHHSVSTITDYPIADMRSIERIGLTRFGQFSYSYVIHPKDGEILEGCGLRRGAHTARKNSASFGICWAGDYNQRVPKVQQLDATRWLINELTRQGHLVPGAPIRGHRDVASTACPGNKLYAMLDVIRVPWNTPTAGPPTVTRTEYPGGEDMLTRHDIDIPALDGQGRGWVELDVPAATVVSIVTNGPYPPVDNYWELPVVARQDRGGKTVVSITEGQPNGRLLLSVWSLS